MKSNYTNCFYFDSLKYIRFESNKLTKNFSLPSQSQLNCIGGDGCEYSKYLDYIDCYNIDFDSLGYAIWNCYPDKFFNYYIYPKLIKFGSLIVKCEDCPDLNGSKNSFPIDYDQQLIYSYESNIKKVNSSCSLNYQMYKIEPNNIYKISNSNESSNNENIYFIVKCIFIFFFSFLFVIVFYKIFYLIWEYYKKNKYVKLTNKDFDNVILINHNRHNYQNEYTSIETV